MGGDIPLAQLAEVGLGHLEDEVHQLGATTAADLKLLDEEDIDSIASLGAADKQRLKAAVARMSRGWVVQLGKSSSSSSNQLLLT